MKKIDIINNRIIKNTVTKPLHYLALLIVLMALTAFNSFSQTNCDVKLSAEFKRTVKTIKDSEYTYTLFLKNSGNVVYEINLSGINYNHDCINPDKLPIETNEDFNINLFDLDFNIIDKNISIEPGENYKFYLNLKVPDGAVFNTWNCTKAIAKSGDCPPITLELHTFNPHPENRE
jgi:hypothetical protein